MLLHTSRMTGSLGAGFLECDVRKQNENHVFHDAMTMAIDYPNLFDPILDSETMLVPLMDCPPDREVPDLEKLAPEAPDTMDCDHLICVHFLLKDGAGMSSQQLHTVQRALREFSAESVSHGICMLERWAYNFLPSVGQTDAHVMCWLSIHVWLLKCGGLA